VEEAVFILKRDNIEVFRAATDAEIMAYIHRKHSFSFHHAIKFEGYSLEETT